MTDLPSNARRLDFHAAKDAGSTAWSRAADGQLQDLGRRDGRGEFRVEFHDGDAHDVVLVEDQEGHVGACDCDGFAFHGSGNRLPGNVCAHLAKIRQMATLDHGLIPDVDGVLEVDAPDREESADQDVEVVADQDDNVQEASADGGKAPAVIDAEARPIDEEDVEDLDEFVTEVAGVPSVFVVDMGRGRDSKPYVTKEGLTYIARKAGIQARAEPLSPSWEGDADLAAYRGIAVDDDGRRYEDVATAHAGEVENTVGRENLDELASTRATNRALQLATGCGFASVEEVDGAEAITPDPDDVDGEGNSTAQAGP